MYKVKNSKKNVYLKHIEEDSWNDMHLYHIENQAIWRNLAILAIIALAIVSLYSIYIVNEDKHKTLVFEKDSSGNIAALGLATKTLTIDNKIVAHQLVNFISSLREVPLDVYVRRRNIDLLHKMIAPNLKKQVDQLVIEQYKKAKVINIAVKSIRPMQGGNSWQISWDEKYFDNDGINLEGLHSFSSIVTFKRLEDVAPEVQLVNPIGLFITYLNPVQDIGT